MTGKKADSEVDVSDFFTEFKDGEEGLVYNALFTHKADQSWEGDAIAIPTLVTLRIEGAGVTYFVDGPDFAGMVSPDDVKDLEHQEYVRLLDVLSSRDVLDTLC